MSYLRFSHLALLSLSTLLYACGGGGGSSDVASSSRPVSSTQSSLTVSSSSASSAAASSIVSSGPSVSSSSNSSRSSSTSSVKTHTSTGVIYCTEAGQDPDGDGWGWENNASCIVRNSNVDPDRGNFSGCIIGTGSWNYCATDIGTWGYENNQICIAQNFCPANRSSSQAALSENLTDVSATAMTEKVYDYLRSIWGSKTLSGQMDQTWKDSIDQYQRVINDTGKAPAIMGYDFMNYGMTGVSGLSQTEEAIAHWNRGGLVTINWHWRVGTGSEKEFYSDKTTFTIPVKNGQLDTSSTAFTQIEAGVDLIAAELKKLQTAGVPVLWRPIHEASGGWFWWGRSRTDGVPPAYAQVLLWQYLHDRLQNYHQLHNLIWVWNGQSAAWYPGDEFVDIVSMDIYDNTDNKTYKSQITTYNTVKQYPLQTKLVALSENSFIPNPDKISQDGAWWLWFMVWNDWDTPEGQTYKDNFWTGEYYNTNAHKTHVYNHANVITLDELPDFDAE